MRTFCHAACLALLAFIAGCGSQEQLPQFQRDITPDVAHADSMRSLIASLDSQLQSEGIPGVQSELLTLEERLEEFKDSSVGENNRDKYDTIIGKLKELAATVEGGKATRPALQESIQELITLADALPKAPAP